MERESGINKYNGYSRNNLLMKRHRKAMSMNIILETQVSMFMCILLFTLIVHAYFKLDIKSRTNKIFMYLQISVLIILVLELVSVIINKSSWINSITLHKLVNVAGFAMAPIPPMLMIKFVLSWANIPEKHSRALLLTLGLPFLVVLGFSLASYRYNLIFNINNQNVYARGPLFWISPLVSYYYYMFSLTVIWRNARMLSIEEKIIFTSAIIFTVILGLIQLKYFIFLTIWNSWAMAVTIIYMLILYEKAKRDILTGLGNRMEYTYYIKSMERKQDKKLSVISIDMDRLKVINDKFGHAEGDHVIKVFAKLLRESFSNEGKCIRMGGDEFIVFIKSDDREMVEECVSNFKMKLEEYNKSIEKPYDINFSYGIEIYDSKYTIDETIKKSDVYMYEQKKQKHAVILNEEIL